MSEKKDQEYFSDGLSEELIDMLAKVPDLRVPARTSSFYFKGKQTKIADIAKANSASPMCSKAASANRQPISGHGPAHSRRHRLSRLVGDLRSPLERYL